jgi:hypothetical protein
MNEKSNEEEFTTSRSLKERRRLKKNEEKTTSRSVKKLLKSLAITRSGITCEGKQRK